MTFSTNSFFKDVNFLLRNYDVCNHIVTIIHSSIYKYIVMCYKYQVKTRYKSMLMSLIQINQIVVRLKDFIKQYLIIIIYPNHFIIL